MTDPVVANAADAARIAWLFRHSLRAGEIHPALHLVQRHRGVTDVVASFVAAAVVPAPATAALTIDPAALKRSLGELPALPQVVLELLTLMGNDGVHSADFASRIENDQALVARTLRLANSPFYGVPGRVGTIRDAIRILGMSAVGTLLTTAAVSSQFNGVACKGFDFQGFWKHVLATGIAARGLARIVGVDGDLAFAAGLLHDIGRLVLAARFPNELAAALQRAHEADCPTLQCESSVMNIDHTDVGAQVARHWHFPTAVVDTIQHHHQPEAHKAGAASMADVIHVADALAHGLDLAQAQNECVPGVAAAAWSQLNVSEEQYLAVLSDTELGVTALCLALAI